MKPEGSLTFPSHSADLTRGSFEDALCQLGCFPMCTLRVNKEGVREAQRILGLEAPNDDLTAVVSPRVNIIIDETYGPYEWVVEYNGKVFWSPGA